MGHQNHDDALDQYTIAHTCTAAKTNQDMCVSPSRQRLQQQNSQPEKRKKKQEPTFAGYNMVGKQRNDTKRFWGNWCLARWHIDADHSPNTGITV